MDNGSKIKYLEMIQEIIKRQSGNSFLIKGWVITLSLAGFGLFVNSGNNQTFLLLVAFITLMFWLLDAYYLKNERLFRQLYEEIASNTVKPVSFSMDVSKYSSGVACITCTMFSFPTVIIYLAIFLMVGFLYYSF